MTPFSRRIVSYVLVFIWAAWMFGLSTESFGDTQTRSWLGRISDSLGLAMSAPALDLCNSVLRKLAHLAEYAVLSLLLYRAISGGAAGVEWRTSTALLCVLGAAAYSMSDEFHQVWVPGRHAALLDCGIDTAGATLAMLLLRFGAGGSSNTGCPK